MKRSKRSLARGKSSSRVIPADYPALLDGIKQRIRAAQVRAALSANAQLIALYWDIGRAIHERQQREGWGAGVIPRLARDLHNEMPELKGFSERNIKRMLAFYRAYPDADPIVTQPATQLPGPEIVTQAAAQMPGSTKAPPPVAQIPWFHHVILLEKVKDLPTRLWYMQQTIAQGWSRNTLAAMIAGRAHQRQGRAVTNFAQRLPAPQSDLAAQTLKDPYIFDFLTLEEPFHERELEAGLVAHVQKFLLELGQGFAFVGRQYHLDVGGDDFYLDLLFYHLRLRCFIVVDLKTGPFKAEYAGKMNFYCNLVDDRLRHPDDQPTIGLILCQDKNRLIAEYALKGMQKAIGVSEYKLTRTLPKQFRSALPTIEQIESELSAKPTGSRPRKKRGRA
ncbi:MAG: PDDEXK nuclease domain-containing protein [Planctomycetota bacterium]|nr:PDDEXK nuclease domain-containing protein [Planctomycetota bacterium]